MRIREHKKELILSFMMVLIGTLSFALGYIFASERNIAPIIIQKYASD